MSQDTGESQCWNQWNRIEKQMKACVEQLLKTHEIMLK